MINWAKVSGQMQIFSEGRPRSLAVLTISELLALFADKALVSPLNKYFLLLLLLLLCKGQFWKWPSLGVARLGFCGFDQLLPYRYPDEALQE